MFASKKHGVFLTNFLFFFLKKAPEKPLQALTKVYFQKKGKASNHKSAHVWLIDETPGLHLGRQRSCCICSSIGKGIAGTNLPKKSSKDLKSSELSKGSLLGPKASHSVRKNAEGLKTMETFEEFSLKLETNHTLEK